jgi:hypothetical protein
MKKLSTFNGLESAEFAQGREERYMHYQSFNRKNAIMTYIQIAVAFLIILVAGVGLYGLTK